MNKAVLKGGKAFICGYKVAEFVSVLIWTWTRGRIGEVRFADANGG